MVEQSGNADGSPTGQERRSNLDLRNCFEKACEVTATLFNGDSTLGGYAHLKMFAQRVIQETFPALTKQEVALLSSSVLAYHRARLENRPRNK